MGYNECQKRKKHVENIKTAKFEIPLLKNEIKWQSEFLKE